MKVYVYKKYSKKLSRVKKQMKLETNAKIELGDSVLYNVYQDDDGIYEIDNVFDKKAYHWNGNSPDLNMNFPDNTAFVRFYKNPINNSDVIEMWILQNVVSYNSTKMTTTYNAINIKNEVSDFYEPDKFIASVSFSKKINQLEDKNFLYVFSGESVSKYMRLNSSIPAEIIFSKTKTIKSSIYAEMILEDLGNIDNPTKQEAINTSIENKILTSCVYKNYVVTVNSSGQAIFKKLSNVTKNIFNMQTKYFIKLSDGTYQFKTEELFTRCESYNQDNLILFTIDGNIIVFNGFKFMKLLNSYDDDYYHLVQSNENNKIRCCTLSDNEMNFIMENNTVVSKEYNGNEMFTLNFVESNLDSKNISSDLLDETKYYNYNSFTADDVLWGGDSDDQEYVQKLLNSEFNYIQTKYISITSTYDLTKLNMELCYLFNIINTNKDKETQLNINIPDIGECNLFDAITLLFAMVCFKSGFDGNIMDTNTKTLTVLGFNFNQDMDYFKQLIIDNKYKRRFPDINLEKMRFTNDYTSMSDFKDIINLYTTSSEVMDYIYKCKYNSKNIYEYNVYKKILQASLYTKYTTDAYRDSKGKLASTYTDYLKESNIYAYKYMLSVTDDNFIDKMDTVLLSLDNYMKTDKITYAFGNIPSLSIDNIKRFIFYLIEIFKSYKCQMKSLNTIYTIDNKYIHNIKTVLKDIPLGKMDQIENLSFDEIITYMHQVGMWDDDIEIHDCIDNLFKLFPEEEHLDLTYDVFRDIVHEHNMSLKTDFFDQLFEMKHTVNISLVLKPLIKQSITSTVKLFDESLRRAIKDQLSKNPGMKLSRISPLQLKSSMSKSIGEIKQEYLDNVDYPVNDNKLFINYDLLDASRTGTNLQLKYQEAYNSSEYQEQHIKLNVHDSLEPIRKEN